MKYAKWIGWTVAAAAVTMTAGCHNTTTSSTDAYQHGEVFVPDTEKRDINRDMDAQAAAGAAKDATLFGNHFNSIGLNSLGRQKLDLILEGTDPAEVLVVYLDLPSDASIGKDRDSVLAYLKDRGLPESQVNLRIGSNPASSIPAAQASTDLAAMRGPAAAGSSAPGTSGASAAPAAGSSNASHY